MKHLLLIALILGTSGFVHSEEPLMTLQTYLSGASCDRPGLIEHLTTAFVSSGSPSIRSEEEDRVDNIIIVTTRFTVWIKGHDAATDQFVLELREAEFSFNSAGKPVKPIDAKTRERKIIGYRLM